MKLKRIVFALSFAAFSLSSFGFDRMAALRTSQGLSEEQIAQSWQLFAAGYEESQKGDPVKAAFLIRQGLAINPAELVMHVFAGSQFELAGAIGQAWAHYEAAGFLDFRAPEGEAAIKRMRRLADQLRNKKVPIIKCVVLGHQRDAYASACDEPQSAKTATGSLADKGAEVISASAAADLNPSSPRPVVLLVQFSGDQEVAQAMKDIIAADLVRANQVVPVGLSQTLSDDDPLPAAFPNTPLAGWVLMGSARTLQDGRTTVRYRLWNLTSRSSPGGRSHSFRMEDLRQVAHHVSDFVEEATVKVPGRHAERLVRVEEGQGRHRIVVADSDGYGPVVAVHSPKALTMPSLVKAAAQTPSVLSYFSYETGKPQLYLQNLGTGQRMVDPDNETLMSCANALAAFEAADAQNRSKYFGSGWSTADAACGTSVRQRATQHQAALRDTSAPTTATATLPVASTTTSSPSNRPAVAATASPVTTPNPPLSTERSHFVIMVAEKGVDAPRKVTTQLTTTDGATVSICGRRFLLAGVAEDGVREFTCAGSGQAGGGRYIDGTRTGDLQWGYAIETDGKSLRTKSYQAWGESVFPDAQEPATLIYYRFTTGPLAGRSYGTIVGRVPGASALYLSSNYISP